MFEFSNRKNKQSGSLHCLKIYRSSFEHHMDKALVKNIDPSKGLLSLKGLLAIKF